MGFWNRLRNSFRRDNLQRDLEEELAAHLEEAIASGRDPGEARRAFGGMLRQREHAADYLLLGWAENLRADVVFGIRQLAKHKVATLAAVLSLGLAIGATMASFRLVDALLFRPLPVEGAERLRVLTYEMRGADGKQLWGDHHSYPFFAWLRAEMRGKVELVAAAGTWRMGVEHEKAEEREQFNRQQVSGWMFPVFGLKPALGRLLSEEDDRTPGKHPVAVLTHHYWQRRFGGDPKVQGRTFKLGAVVCEIVGVTEKGFSGMEPGRPADVFTPMNMNSEAIGEDGYNWFRIWLRLPEGVSEEALRQELGAKLRAWREAKAAKGDEWADEGARARYFSAPVRLEDARAGYSDAQKKYRQSLGVLAALVGLVLLIACANVANLMTGQAMARAKEMALRVSIGAGRARLVQLVLVESALLAVAATVAGAAFSAWSAPFVVGMLQSPEENLQLDLYADARVWLFGAALSLGVTLLFGLLPTLRASGVQPAAALKGEEAPKRKQRVLYAMLAAQVAFCFVVHFAAGLFWASLDRLSAVPLGFDTGNYETGNLVNLEVEATPGQKVVKWEALTERLRQAPMVEQAAAEGWPLLGGNFWTPGLEVDGKRLSGIETYMLSVGPGWFETMKIPLVSGRDFRPTDVHPRVVIVNEAFVRAHFGNQNPLGRRVENSGYKESPYAEVVGVVKDAVYGELRKGFLPVAYVPFERLNDRGEAIPKPWGNFALRLRPGVGVGDVKTLGRELESSMAGIRVGGMREQQALVDAQMVRERLLAALAAFFAVLALILAGVGLYGVLDYTVAQQRREIGIRMALGAPPEEVARKYLLEVLGVLAVGSLVGLLLGVGSERYIASLLFEIKASDWQMMLLPLGSLGLTGLFATAAPLWRAITVDPATTLRAQ
ncbi:MAG: ADOP family duplicated permease [Bryobacter sp.]|nr:ADOP family duplicated permease [Bryobacter sp.]